MLLETYIKRRTLIVKNSRNDWVNYKLFDSELGDGYSIVIASPFDITEAIIYIQTRIKEVFSKEQIFSSMAWANALISLYGLKSGNSLKELHTIDLVALFGTDFLDTGSNIYLIEDSIIKIVFEAYLEEH